MSEQTPQEKAPIGVAWMEEDRSIVVRVRAEHEGTVAEANMLFTTAHPKYKKVVAYLGYILPDEAKSLYEWDFSLQ